MPSITIAPSLAKWGLSATDMTPAAMIAATDPKTFYNLAWQFKQATAGAVIAPIIPPQGLIRPGKDEVDVDLYIIWAGTGASATDKVGWIVNMVQIQEGDSLMKLAGGIIDTSNLYRDDNGEVDWGVAGPPDDYLDFPYMQYGLAYDLVGTTDWALHKTKVRSFKMSGGVLGIDRDRRSFGKIAGTVSGKQVFAGLYIWRAIAGKPVLSLPAAFAGGAFDVDGDGAVDSDNFASDDVYLLGVIGEFK
jgi:hypothetical protein